MIRNKTVRDDDFKRPVDADGAQTTARHGGPVAVGWQGRSFVGWEREEPARQMPKGRQGACHGDAWSAEEH